MPFTPFLFGDPDSPLYGAYHEPEGEAPRPAVLLAGPHGQEAIRANRMFRVIADRLARRGHPVLRFDWFGTGDSDGDCAEATLTRWIRDLQVAHEVLRERSGPGAVAWIGLRLGAMVASLASATRPEGLASLLLWEPVLGGASYLDELAEAHERFMASHRDESVRDRRERRARQAPGRIEALGVEIPERLAAELRAVRPGSLRWPDGLRLAICGTSVGDEGSVPLAAERLSVSDDLTWNSDESMNDFLVPIRTIQAIESWVGR